MYFTTFVINEIMEFFPTIIQENRTSGCKIKNIKRKNTSRSSEPQGALVRRVCLSYSRKKSLMRSLIGYNDEQSLKRNRNIFFPSSK